MLTQQTVAEQYKHSSNLEARIALHERFSTSKYKWHEWVFDQFDLPDTARILELGCGVGKLWLDNLHRLPPRWDITLTDFSAGMLRKTQDNLADSGRVFSYRVMQAPDIAFADEHFDAVIANHMLYYVDDKPRAMREIRRVLKPRGRIYTATNGLRHMHELVELIAEFDAAIPFVERMIESYTLESGAGHVAGAFGDVVVRRYPDALLVTDVAALTGYILSSSAVFKLPQQKQTALAHFVKQRFEAQGGVFSVTKDAGLICARR
jgi:SAM-dependent methyltransferase